MAQEIEARELTRQGIVRARAFLGEVRDNPAGPLAPPPELLQGSLTRRCQVRIQVKRPAQPFATRREIAEYLSPRLRAHRAWIADRTPFWSWLGIFHFEDTVRIKDDGAAILSPLDETFVVASQRDDAHNYRGMHRHYLRTAWLLGEVHGEKAAYLLDRPPTDRGNLSDRTLQNQRIFNSVGIIPLVLRLYTRPGSPPTMKVGHMDRPGGLRHLVHVLNQLERTYDVYGMEPEALIRILPPEFAPWIEGDDPPTPDPALHDWERTFRRNGRGKLRYVGCLADLVVEAETEAIAGPVTDSAGTPIGRVHAPTAEDAVEQIKRLVRARR